MTRKEPATRASNAGIYGGQERHAHLNIAGTAPVAPTPCFFKVKGTTISPSQRVNACIPRPRRHERLLQAGAMKQGLRSEGRPHALCGR